jgi:hypothetical protein
MEFPITVLIEFRPLFVLPPTVVSNGNLLKILIPVLRVLHAFCFDGTREGLAQYVVEIVPSLLVAVLTVVIMELRLLPTLTVETYTVEKVAKVVP